MSRYYFYHRLAGDLEVPVDLFDDLIQHLTRPDKNGHCRYKLFTVFDDEEQNVVYYYVWSRHSDFLYIGYVERS